MLQIRKLYCTPSIFDAIPFFPGVNLILGQPSEGNAKTNGVGKSVAIEFLNFALLNSYSDSRVKKIPESVFPLEVEVCVDLSISGKEVTIQRSRANESKPLIRFDGKDYQFTKIADAHSFLGDLAFESNSTTRPSFRSLLSILIRDERSEFKSIINGHNTEARVPDDYTPHLYLLGISVDLYKRVKELQKEISDLKKKITEYNKSVMLLRQKKIDDARADLNELDAEVELISRDIENLENSASFDSLEEEMQELDDQISDRRRQSAVLLEKLSRLRPLEEEKVEISTSELAEYYNDLRSGLGDFISRDFEELKLFKTKIYRFQDEVLRKRRVDLEKQLRQVKSELRALDKEYQKRLRLLDQDGALKALKQTFANYKEKSDQVADLRSFISGHDTAVSDKREKVVEKDTEVLRLQANIDQVERVKTSFQETVLEIHKFIMGNRQASFTLTTVGLAQVIDLILRIDSDGSHSVEREKTFIYDFALLINEFAAERHLGFLIHDNIFEVDTDTLKRSLRFILDQSSHLDGQYILTLNSDRVSAEAPELLESLDRCVRARFTKDSRFLKSKYQQE